MIVCVCNNVSEDKIVNVIEKHEIVDIDVLREKIAVCNQCCMCERYINNLIELMSNEAPLLCA